jgi:hypothetical protein
MRRLTVSRLRVRIDDWEHAGEQRLCRSVGAATARLFASSRLHCALQTEEIRKVSSRNAAGGPLQRNKIRRPPKLTHLVRSGERDSLRSRTRRSRTSSWKHSRAPPGPAGG